MNDPPLGDKIGPPATHEVHERKKSVVIPALMAGALAALLAVPLLSRYRSEQVGPVAPPPAAPPPAAQPAAVTEGETQGTFGPRGTTERTSVYLSPEVLGACSLNQPGAYFALDSAVLAQEDAGALQKLAGCLRSGPLGQAVIEIVGRADATGPSEHNLALGQGRADAVASYLRSAGVGTERIRTSSAGEQNARANDPQGQAVERRVDVRLVR